MDIEILHYSTGARHASGLAVVIDVFRAFSVACYVLDQGAEKIVAVAEIEYARQLQREHPDWILIGERGGAKLAGFDFGNSPTELHSTPFVGKTVVHTTHAGTTNLCAASNAEDVVTGSFLNAGATIHYIRQTELPTLSLICAGVGDEREAREDVLCAQYIRDTLSDTPRPFDEIKRELREAEASRRFFDPSQDHSPESDFHRCLDLDKFDFVIRRTEFGDGTCVLKKIAV